MKIYGYTKNIMEQIQPKPLNLTEVTLVATPQELRQIAAFLLQEADDMEKLESGFEHAHLSDSFSSFENDPQFIIWNDSLK